MKHEIKSTLEKVIQQVWAEPDMNKAKDLILSSIDASKIKDDDKKRIRINLNEIKTKPKLDYYLANSLLRYEGHSVNRYN